MGSHSVAESPVNGEECAFVGYNFSLSCSIVGLGRSLVDRVFLGKSSEGAMASYSGDSVLSPLKTHVTNTSNPSESVHTLAVDDADCQSKGSYETARDKRVAELQKLFKPVQEAALTLSVLFLSPLLSCCFC